MYKYRTIHVDNGLLDDKNVETILKHDFIIKDISTTHKLNIVFVLMDKTLCVLYLVLTHRDFIE